MILTQRSFGVAVTRENQRRGDTDLHDVLARVAMASTSEL